ncbi:hypothetical protein [Fusobacterium sp.]|uniref:hypothetical protein n=1 Tax=Fusobacterium sp. TaxID=68766 RepID=UPI0029004E9B|nr:hypothetical protein [Fusobacterium sp.]MDU1911125.1 hypothetical protein [Fusobacterium sp.]
MKNYFDRFVLELGLVLNFIAVILISKSIFDNNRNLIKIVEYLSMSKSIIIFAYWVLDDFFRLKYYLGYFLSNLLAMSITNFLISPNIIYVNFKFVPLIIFLVGLFLAVINSLFYQTFKISSYANNKN